MSFLVDTVQSYERGSWQLPPKLTVCKYHALTDVGRIINYFVVIAVAIFTGAQGSLADSVDIADPLKVTRQIQRIETYGVHSVSREAIVLASGLNLGDDLHDESIPRAIEQIEAIPEVCQADVFAVFGRILKDEGLGTIVYIGIKEDGFQRPQYRCAPTGKIRLPLEIIQAAQNELHAFERAAASGEFGEDRSKGHSLSTDCELREAQEKFIDLAELHWDTLTTVLANAQESSERAIAAKVIAYARDKRKVIEQLTPMLQDPDPLVRNNAGRALSVIFSYAKAHPELSLSATPDLVHILIGMLDSVQWSDRNKAVAMLLKLDEEELVLKELRLSAVSSLIEMAQWQSSHGEMAFMLLGRLVGMSHDQSSHAWERNEHSATFSEVVKQVSNQ
jgi:hypothetical protein